MTSATPTVASSYPETPAGLASRWAAEFGAARTSVEKWHKRAEEIIQRYLDSDGDGKTRDDGTTRLNLFTANTQTMSALLYGKTPQVDVARRFADSQDDQARVASEMLERLLNTDIEQDGDTQEAFRAALEDRLIVGLGNVKLRYERSTQTVPGRPAMTGEDGGILAEEVPETEALDYECVEVDYIFWKDQLWSPARTFTNVRWWAFANPMGEEAFKKRFPEGEFTANEKKAGQDNETKTKDPLDRCVVWEIWSKERKTVDWYVEGQATVLDHKADPYQLESFWPFPRPMFANLTSSRLIPTPDFTLAQDLYDEIDTISTRITLIEQCIRVAGLYDKNSDEIKRLINDTAANELIGVDSWNAFAEKGGIQGRVDWMPIEQLTAALTVLREYRTELIGLLFQVTGYSDIMRGQAQAAATATEQAIKARFASVRVQSMQDEFARFCSDVQKIKAEIISKHFDPQTIIECSNIMRTPDAALAMEAVQLIKSDFYQYRISVNPDSVSLTDFAALKAERMEWLQVLSGFFQGVMPIVQAMPGSLPFMLQLAQATLSGLKGSNELEGMFDQAIAAAKQQLAQAAANPPPPPPPDPRLQAAQVKAGAEQFRAKADIAQTGMDLQAAKAKHAMDMQKLEAQTRKDAMAALNQSVPERNGAQP